LHLGLPASVAPFQFDPTWLLLLHSVTTASVTWSIISMTHTLAVVKAIGVTKNRDRDVVSGRIDVTARKTSSFLNFSPKSLGNVDRLFPYSLLVADLPFFMAMLLVTCISLGTVSNTVCLHLPTHPYGEQTIAFECW